MYVSESRFIPTLFLILGWGYQPERVQSGTFFVVFYFVGFSSFVVWCFIRLQFFGSLCLFSLCGNNCLVGGLLS